jgi:hypothetical protein
LGEIIERNGKNVADIITLIPKLNQFRIYFLNGYQAARDVRDQHERPTSWARRKKSEKAF